jgi:hypothetical protein
MNPPQALGAFPTKKLAGPPKVLSVNHQDPYGEFIVRGIVLQFFTIDEM